MTVGLTRDSITIGGRTFFDLDNSLILQAGSSSANSYSSLVLSPNTAGYLVPTDKILEILAFKTIVASTTDMNFSFGYCDNDTGYMSSTAPTTPVHFGSNTSTIHYMNNIYGATNGNMEDAVYFQVPTNKYPFMRSNGNAMIYATFFCRLIDE